MEITPQVTSSDYPGKSSWYCKRSEHSSNATCFACGNIRCVLRSCQKQSSRMMDGVHRLDSVQSTHRPVQAAEKRDIYTE
eukprot:1102561-Amphidinium_carterae.2